MKSILIVEPSEVIRADLELELHKRYRIFSCKDGTAGLELLRCRPDGMILNLELSGMDSLTFLETAGDLRPKAILALSTVYPDYVKLQLYDLGVSYSLTTPAPTRVIVRHIERILQTVDIPVEPDYYAVTGIHLQILDLPHHQGHEMLRFGVTLYHQDPMQSFTKELYPAIAKVCGCANWKQVETSIRNVIKAGWEKRDDEVWRQYFSDPSVRPTNKTFIARLSELLDA